MLKKVVQQAAASEEARRTLRNVEPLSEVRTPLADFFSILLILHLHYANEPGIEVGHDCSLARRDSEIHTGD